MNNMESISICHAPTLVLQIQTYADVQKHAFTRTKLVEFRFDTPVTNHWQGLAGMYAPLLPTSREVIL